MNDSTSPFAELAAAKLARLPIGCLDCERASIVQEAIDAALESAMGRTHYKLAYQCLQGEESSGSHGTFGIRILVAHKALDLSTRRDPDNETELEKALHHAGYDAVDKITDAVMRIVIANDPKAQEHVRAEREQLLGLFAAPIYVETIPNGYDSRWPSAHLPWFVVTTSVGRIKIGWRKRVIFIDWTETQGTKTADELFAAEDVTKSSGHDKERYIHAWSVEKAKSYIDAIIASASAS